MAKEIERKFLVSSDTFKKEAFEKIDIKQGFLNSNKNRVVRVRIQDDKGFITVKGKTKKGGTTRFEWEKEIDKRSAEGLLKLCEYDIIEKYRYLVNHNNSLFEVDVFSGKNQGLVVAEIELDKVDQVINKPIWLGKEITGKKKYYNARLCKHPFSNWHKKAST